MKTIKKEYTAEETATFLFERNSKRNTERRERKTPQFIHISQMMVRSKDANGNMLPFMIKAWKTGKTFVGSVRQQFTGEKRCGITNN